MSASAKRRAKKSAGGKGSEGAMEVEKKMKVAKAAGAAQAKRGAAVNARRGLGSGKASAKDIKASQKKAQNKVVVASAKKGGRPGSKGGAKGGARALLKIKFSTKLHESSAPKGMMAQIKGVLSKQPKSNNAPARQPTRPKSAGNIGRQVVAPKQNNGRVGGGQKSNGRGGRR